MSVHFSIDRHFITFQIIRFHSNHTKLSAAECFDICRNPGLNQGPLDLQSNALPTELFRPTNITAWHEDKLEQIHVSARLAARFNRFCNVWHVQKSVILDSIVVSIPACHAGDRGSIPRRGDWHFFLSEIPAAAAQRRQSHRLLPNKKTSWPSRIETSQPLPWPGFEPGLSRPQREVLTTIRSRL